MADTQRVLSLSSPIDPGIQTIEADSGCAAAAVDPAVMDQVFGCHVTWSRKLNWAAVKTQLTLLHGGLSNFMMQSFFLKMVHHSW